MSDFELLTSVEADLRRLKEAALRAGEAFGLFDDDEGRDELHRDRDPIDAAPDMWRFASILGLASITLMSF
jgi:hypothetical protein